MVVHNVVFPQKWSEGSAGGPGFRTIIQTVAGGRRNATITQAAPRYRYNVTVGVRQFAEGGEFTRFVIARHGGAYGFRMLDPLDYTSAADGISAPSLANSQVIGVGNGTATIFQLSKVYADSANSVSRTVTLPISGTVQVWEDDVLKGSGVTVDHMTGRVTLSPAPSMGVVIKAAFQYHVPVAFGQEVDEWFRVQAFRNTVNLQGIVLEEIPDHVQTWDRPWPGGGLDKSGASITGDTAVSIGDGMVQAFLNTSGSTRNLFMPSKDGIAEGGPIFVIHLASGSSHDVVIADGDTSTAFGGLTAGETAEVVLTSDAFSAKKWIACK